MSPSSPGCCCRGLGSSAFDVVEPGGAAGPLAAAALGLEGEWVVRAAAGVDGVDAEVDAEEPREHHGDDADREEALLLGSGGELRGHR